MPLYSLMQHINFVSEVDWSNTSIQSNTLKNKSRPKSLYPILWKTKRIKSSINQLLIFPNPIKDNWRPYRPKKLITQTPYNPLNRGFFSYLALNKNLDDIFTHFIEDKVAKSHIYSTFAAVDKPCVKSADMKKYLSEKNALTVMVSLFCFVMMILSLASKQSLWETIAFALAFSFSVEIICHRTKENNN